jgi:hypothetical protein
MLVITVLFLIDLLEIFTTELFLVFQKKDLILSLVDYHVKRAVHCWENVQHKPGKIEGVLLTVTALNFIFKDVQLDT